jgi:Transposase IS116/IS110/IS902 family
VLYQHGVAQRHDLLTADKRQWLEDLELPAAAREQVTVALTVIDALDAQSAPLTRELRADARRQPGCRALMRHYGIGALTAVTILAELGDARRFSSSRHAVRYAGLDITVHSPTSAARRGTSLGRARPRCAGRSTRRRSSLAARAVPTTPTTSKPPPGSVATVPAWRSLANSSSAATTPCANSETRPWCPPSGCSRCARSPHRQRCPAAGSPHAPAATVTTWPAQKDRAAAPRQPAGTPHQPSRHRPAARPDRGPRQGRAPARTTPTTSTAPTGPRADAVLHQRQHLALDAGPRHR